MDPTARRLFLVPASLAMAAGSALGFYLVRGEPAIPGLVTSGHVHLLLFALSAIAMHYLVSQLEKPAVGLARWMGGLSMLTYTMPIALLIAGFVGNTAYLRYTTGIGGGALVVIWLVMAVLLLFRPKQKA